MNYKYFVDKYLNITGADEEILFMKRFFIIMLFFPALFSIFILAFWSNHIPSSVLIVNAVTLLFYALIILLLIYSRYQLNALLFWTQIILISTWFFAIITLPENRAGFNWLNEIIIVLCFWLDGLFVVFLSLFSSSIRKALWVFTFYISTVIVSLILHPLAEVIPEGILFDNILLFVINLLWIAFIVLFPILFFIRNRSKIARQEAEKLKELDKAKGALFTNITHEFRTPLTVIDGTVGILKEIPEIDADHHILEKLETIEKNSNSLLHLVNQMLDISLLENNSLSLNLVQADVIPYLQYIADNFHSFAESKRLRLTVYCETEKIIMDYDPDQLYKVVSNLLVNAIKFTPENGQVIYHFKKDEINNELLIKVNDNGPGIPPQDLSKIFRRFYKGRHSFKNTEGTGIGLSLTKDLVEMMDGRITVNSTPGKGSEFIVQIPITTLAERSSEINTKEYYHKVINTYGSEQEQISDLTSNMDDTEKKLILIVEDNADLAEIMKSYLSNKFNTLYAKNGLEGINKAVELIPDIIISDVLMPERDGYELCQFLKKDERTSHIPIILLTAKSTEQDKLNGLVMGADAYLVKPFNKAELFIRIESLLALRKQLRQKYSSLFIANLQKKESVNDSFLEKVINIISSQISNPKLNNLELAHSMKLSESQLFRKLKALTGRSPSAFIRYIRLLRAKELLGNSEMNVAEIAFKTGFNNHAWFSNVFKKEFGYSPSEFRQQITD